MDLQLSISSLALQPPSGMAGDPGKEGLLVMFGGRFLVERFQAFDMCVSSEGRADCKLPYLPFPSTLPPSLFLSFISCSQAPELLGSCLCLPGTSRWPYIPLFYVVLWSDGVFTVKNQLCSVLTWCTEHCKTGQWVRKWQCGA